MRDALGRKVSATEMVEEPESPPQPYIVPRPERPCHTTGDRLDNERAAEVPQASTHTIQVMYDMNYLPNVVIKRPHHYRRSAVDTVSVETDGTDMHFAAPRTVVQSLDNEKLSPDSHASVSNESQAQTVLHHSFSGSFELPSETLSIASPLNQHHLFARKKSGPQHRSSLPQQRSASKKLEDKCSQLYGERELLADHLESTLYKLAGAREQLQFAKEALANRENDAKGVNEKVAGLKRGMDVALQHYNAMARELNDLKREHIDCGSPSCRCSFIDRLRRTPARVKIRELKRELSRAQSDLQEMHERWRSSHRNLMSIELVLEKQRQCMKAKIDKLKHTRAELAAVRRKLQVTERALQDRKVSIEVLRQSNRDLLLEIACLKHRNSEKRHVTV